MKDDFIISMERSGGFAGLTSSIRIDAKKLSEGEIIILWDLLQSSGVLDSPKNKNINPVSRDTFQYIISIEDQNGIRTIEMNESTQVSDCHKLFNLLKSLSKK